MTPLAYAVAPTTPLEEVVGAMADNRYGSALVIDRGKLVGVFTTVDALRATIALCRARK
jgi:acetoin utilization protein AcuB